MNRAVTAISDKSVLVVDDDPPILRALEKVLREEGLHVVTAFEAEEAVGILTRREQKIDLVITDLRMPFVTGMTLLYAIREIFPHLPVIVLTAFGNAEIRAECLQRGAVAFIEKPVKSQELIETVTKAFELQRADAQWTEAVQGPKK